MGTFEKSDIEGNLQPPPPYPPEHANPCLHFIFNSLKFESENDNYIWTIATKGATSCGTGYFCYPQDYFEEICQKNEDSKCVPMGVDFGECFIFVTVLRLTILT
jgi:hypothetical protein